MAKRGIILMNLGSPDSTKVKDLRKYLSEFLMDKRVIDLPWLKRFLLIRGIIVPLRAPKSADAYKKIWWKEGSPLVVLTEKLKVAIQQKTDEPVEISMRYGKPNPETAYENLLKRCPDLEEVLLVPLYPHYAMSSYETALEYMKEVHKKKKYSFQLKAVAPFYQHPAYIDALAQSIEPHLQEPFDQLLFSYHGIPERHIIKSDPTAKHCLQSEDCCCQPSLAHKTCYRHQVTITTKLVIEKLGLDKSKWQQSYQSRLGRNPWLLPNTQVRLDELPKEGIKKLLVVCPSFVSDCLETLEEIDIRGRGDFLKNGGVSYKYIPCMNTNDSWVNALLKIIKEVN